MEKYNEWLTQNQIADLAGYSSKQLRRINDALDEGEKLFVKDGEDGQKGYNLGLFIQRWAAYSIKKEIEGIQDLDQVRAAHEIVKKRKTELQVHQMEGTLVDAQEVGRVWDNICNNIMQNMIHLPGTLAPMLQGMTNTEEIKSVIDAEIRKVLEEIANRKEPAYRMLQENGEEEE